MITTTLSYLRRCSKIVSIVNITGKSSSVKTTHNSPKRRGENIFNSLLTILDWQRYATSQFMRNPLPQNEQLVKVNEEVTSLLMYQLQLPDIKLLEHWKYANITLGEKHNINELINKRLLSKQSVIRILNRHYFHGEWITVNSSTDHRGLRLLDYLLLESMLSSEEHFPSIASSAFSNVDELHSTSASEPISSNYQELDYDDYFGELVDTAKITKSIIRDDKADGKDNNEQSNNSDQTENSISNQLIVKPRPHVHSIFYLHDDEQVHSQDLRILSTIVKAHFHQSVSIHDKKSTSDRQSDNKFDIVFAAVPSLKTGEDTTKYCNLMLRKAWSLMKDWEGDSGVLLFTMETQRAESLTNHAICQLSRRLLTTSCGNKSVSSLNKLSLQRICNQTS